MADFGYSSSYQTGASSGDAEFQRLSQLVGTNIQKISQNVSSLQRMVNQIGTQADSEDLRTKLHQIQHYTNQLAKDTNKSIKELNNIPQPVSQSDVRQRKMHRERLMNEFTSSLNQFQSAQRRAAEREKASVKRARAHSGANQFDDQYGGGSADGDEQLISFDSAGRAQPRDKSAAGAGGQQQSQAMMMEEDVPLAELQEREASIRKLESDILDVNQIFKDLGMMVHEQGEVIDSIEANVESAQIHVEDGAQQLAKARTYQTKARKKMLCIAVVLTVVAGVLALIIYLSTK